MFDQYISSSSYFAFPSFAVAIYSILLALVLSTVLAITYRLTHQRDNFSNNFFQAIVLSSTVSTMVMMAVGDNLAVGFGVLGAVSIIRFRTLIRNPRNIIFIFASLSIGIATGVFGYAIAISGTVLFCISVFLLWMSPYGKEAGKNFQVQFAIKDGVLLDQFNQFLVSSNSKGVIHQIRNIGDDMTRYTYMVSLKPGTDKNKFYLELTSIEGLENIRFEYQDQDEKL